MRRRARRRVAIADAAETMWGRKVSWGVRCGGHEVRFTTTAVPVMTRLRMEERAVLDTLIDAGVARSRSEALAWCVRLVGPPRGRVDRRAAHRARRGGEGPCRRSRPRLSRLAVVGRPGSAGAD